MTTNQPTKKSDENKTHKNRGGEKKTENKKIQNGAGDIVNDFIEDVWKVMTPAMIERLKHILTEDFGLSKAETNKFIQCQRDIRRQRICLKKAPREVRIGPRNQWIKELSKDIADQIAKFIVGILLSERNDRTKNLTEQVLDRLCEVTGENTTIECAETRVERLLVIVADRLATWIHENITDVEQQLREKLSGSLETFSDVTFAAQESIGSLKSYDIRSEATSDVSKDRDRFKDSLVTFDSDVESLERDSELSEDEWSHEKESEDEVSSSERSDLEEESENKSDKSTSDEESSVQESEEESSEVEEEGEEEESGDVDEEEESGEDESGDAESGEAESDEEETEGEEEEQIEEEESVAEESIAAEEGEEISKHTSVTTETFDVQSESEITTSAVAPMDIIDLLREDLERLPKAETKSGRQQAIKEVIDKRLKKIAQEKQTGSLDSLVKYDIDETASLVANWLEKILSAADDTDALPKDTAAKQGSAFEIMRGEGSELKVHKLSSMTVAKQVAELRGLEPPLRKKKIPRTMSPINVNSMNDWADWALGAANVGKEWDKWLDETLADVESQLVEDRDSESKEKRHETWKEWRETKAKEATKWRAEKRRIKAEGALWNRKLEGEQRGKPEQETGAVTY